MKDLTNEERDSNISTLMHIANVRKAITKIIKKLMDRAEEHDQTKMEDPELTVFAEYTPKLATSTYGSEEYKEFLVGMKPALDHHYAAGRHHPEHFPNGVEDMNLVDLVEMFADWDSAAKRHANGNIMKSIEINTDRFHLSPQLVKILKNTVDLLQN